MIDMHVHLPEKYRSPFLHGVFLFSKVGVLVVNFDGFFIFAYSSHIMWAGPLEGFCYSFLYLKGWQLCLIFLERESWSQPYRVFFIAPQLDHAPKCSIRVWEWGYVKEGLTRSCFHAEILEFQSYSRHRNHFGLDSKQTRSEEIQVIPIERFSEMMKTFYLLLVKNMKWHLVCQKRFKFQIWGLLRTESVQSIYFISMNNDLTRTRKHCLPIQIACLWSERAWIGM